MGQTILKLIKVFVQLESQLDQIATNVRDFLRHLKHIYRSNLFQLSTEVCSFQFNKNTSRHAFLACFFQAALSDHPTTKRPRLQDFDSKKLGCMACLNVRHLVMYPGFSVHQIETEISVSYIKVKFVISPRILRILTGYYDFLCSSSFVVVDVMLFLVPHDFSKRLKI